MTFTRKGYGRIFVEKKEHIKIVKDEIKEMDECEYQYMPNDIIAVFDENNIKMEYTHKFDALNLEELQIRLWLKGIYIIYIDNCHNEYYERKVTYY